MFLPLNAARVRFQREFGLRMSWYRAYVVSTAAIFAVIVTLYAVFSSPSDFPVDVVVSVGEGSLTEVAEELAGARVVRSALWLKVFVFATGNSRSVKAGDYVFEDRMGTLSVAHRIATGTFGIDAVKITIPEGASRAEMAKIIATRLSHINEIAFMRKTEGMEGYLFPDTYFFMPRDDEDDVIGKLRATFDAKVATIAPEIAAFGADIDDVVTMASLLEKEARLLETKQKIADVLWRRLKIGMALQVDAVFLYINGKNSFTLTKKDLVADHPYNTYVHPGLPPGPIASPSLESLLAAVTPIKTPYLYYLADHDGVTHFSETYEGHQANRRRYLD